MCPSKTQASIRLTNPSADSSGQAARRVASSPPRRTCRCTSVHQRAHPEVEAAHQLPECRRAISRTAIAAISSIAAGPPPVLAPRQSRSLPAPACRSAKRSPLADPRPHPPAHRRQPAAAGPQRQPQGGTAPGRAAGPAGRPPIARHPPSTLCTCASSPGWARSRAPPRSAARSR